ncbi:MOSC domain-containing protein [Bythopirellula polymerisocia]|uniref:6-N-hydroxylaminopurine resistance protein n=1 Tax=Bythopirellula polymerisocia TaxID=2528003 RepID=A0A5C6D0Q9_9BACT|nr:MOSC domain-containing protein [Bythopirellula polymerisocia]TWU29331.1 6-N-hydroxylaminopurine resistance protein [Bythopirellula polymerisocia]
MNLSLVSIQVGRPRQYDGDSAKPWSSGIDKRQVEGPIFVSRTNLVGDQQADLIHHGGPDKAVLAYAYEHYAVWNAELPDKNFAPGGFGENLTIRGLDESTCHIGDIVRIGECLLQISQPRQPCWKLSGRWNMPDLAMLVQKNGRSGWYYRVLEEGTIQPGDVIELVEHKSELTVAWASRVMYAKPRSAEDDLMLANCPALSASWRETLKNRSLGKEASSEKRLFGQ